jgi:hypothetical protein
MVPCFYAWSTKMAGSADDAADALACPEVETEVAGILAPFAFDAGQVLVALFSDPDALYCQRQIFARRNRTKGIQSGLLRILRQDAHIRSALLLACHKRTIRHPHNLEVVGKIVLNPVQGMSAMVASKVAAWMK